MSEESWRKEFYPIPAYQCSRKNALEHSLLKWTGALKKNLKKHSLMEAPITFYGSTCALCLQFYDAELHHTTGSCGDCPLFRFLGGSCTEKKYSLSSGEITEFSPYGHYAYANNPKPMVRVLRNTLKREKSK